VAGPKAARRPRKSSNNGGRPERPPSSGGGLEDMLADAATSPIRRWFPGVAAAKVGAKDSRSEKKSET